MIILTCKHSSRDSLQARRTATCFIIEHQRSSHTVGDVHLDKATALVLRAELDKYLLTQADAPEPAETKPVLTKAQFERQKIVPCLRNSSDKLYAVFNQSGDPTLTVTVKQGNSTSTAVLDLGNIQRLYKFIKPRFKHLKQLGN